MLENIEHEQKIKESVEIKVCGLDLRCGWESNSQ